MKFDILTKVTFLQGRYVDTFKAVLEHQQKDISERQVVLFDREVVSEHWPSQHNVCFLHESTVSAYPEIGPSNLWVNGNITRTVQGKLVDDPQRIY